MSLLHLAGGGSSADDKLYVEDVFTSYLRTGTGADVVVNTGIDMTKGYMLWSKGRSGTTDHAIYDSARGVTKDLVANSIAAETTQATGLKSVSTTGHTIGSLAKMNTSSATYVDWVMRKAPKFFDVVTYTGNTSNARAIPHSLGVSPGMVIIKALSISPTISDNTNWHVWHRKDGVSPTRLVLNATYLGSATTGISVPPTASSFYVDYVVAFNEPGVTYVAYLFAHDPSADGMIQCGSFTTDASGIATVNLGWEPQYVMVKSSSHATSWVIIDTARGWVNTSGTDDVVLSPNLSNAEIAGASYGNPTATGFYMAGQQPSYTFIYLAIRRPMKVPTSGTEVYNAIARTGTGAAATVSGVGFAPDLVIPKAKAGNPAFWSDRLRGKGVVLGSDASYGETTGANYITEFGNASFSLGTASNVNQSGLQFINWVFKRAKGFFDIVCYTGTGVTKTVNHSLGVVPELMIVKSRSVIAPWFVGAYDVNKYGFLNLTDAFYSDFASISTAYSSNFTLSETTGAGFNQSGSTYVAYLFATLANVSKCFSYVGNGSSQNIECGFSSGARFVLIKASSATGDWLVADSTRGITSGTDPRLSLNTTTAEITTEDWLDPYAGGFTVNQVAGSNANVNGVTYIGLAIA